MARAQEVLKTALPYLDKPEVRKEFSVFADALARDLDDVGYDESEEMAEATEAMHEFLNTVDAAQEDTTAEIKELAAEGREMQEDEG